MSLDTLLYGLLITIFWVVIGIALILWGLAVYLFCKHTFYLDEWRDTMLETLFRDVQVTMPPRIICADCEHDDFDLICGECGSENQKSVPRIDPKDHNIRDSLREADRIMGYNTVED